MTFITTSLKFGHIMMTFWAYFQRIMTNYEILTLWEAWNYFLGCLEIDRSRHPGFVELQFFEFSIFGTNSAVPSTTKTRFFDCL